MSIEMANSPDASARSNVSLEAALVAQRYYLEDRQKSEIAAEMGISRFKVARLLEEAKASGIVRIYIDMPHEIDMPLASEIEKAFGVTRVIVARSVPGSVESTADLRGRVAADYLKSVIGPHDTLGISWGDSVSRVVDAVEKLPPIDIVQVVGGLRSSELDISGTELVRRLSRISGGRAYPLLAPLIVESPETAVALRKDAALIDSTSQFENLSVAVIGIGSWAPAQSSMASELSDTDRAEVLNRGAVADVCGILIDASGEPVETSIAERTISISASTLRKVPSVIAVAGGLEKVDAIHAALKSGLVSVLVTDSPTAEALIKKYSFAHRA